MFERKLKIFKLFGFTVYVDLSWVIIAVLITWSLAQGYFPYFYENLSPRDYWIMGVIGALGLFFSIVFHEMSHSLVSRVFGLDIKGITLFIFGGIAEMQEEPENPKTEFYMAIAGPLSSLFLAAVFYGAYRAGMQTLWPVQVEAVFKYLALINGILAGFNLVPAYPLDGGRVLRSALWKWKGNLRQATRFATQIGSGFGVVLIVLGIANILMGNFIGGMWWVLIGLFLRSTSQMSYTQLLMKKALSGEPVSRFMKKDPVTVKPTTTIDELINEYFYRHHHKMYPVVDETGELQGCVTLKNIKELPREQWKEKTVGDLSPGCSDEDTVRPGADSMKALSTMNKRRSGRLMVVENGHLQGVITLKDLLEFLSIKLDLEEDEAEPLVTRP